MPSSPLPFVWTAPKIIVAGALVLAVGGTGAALYPVVRDAILGSERVQEGARGNPCREQTHERGIAIFCDTNAGQPSLSTTRNAAPGPQPKAPSQPRGTLSDW